MKLELPCNAIIMSIVNFIFLQSRRSPLAIHDNDDYDYDDDMMTMTMF